MQIQNRGRRRICLACCALAAVAQISICCITLYRRIVFSRASDGPTHRNFPTPRTVQLCDTAQRGEAATKGARVCDPQGLCRPPSVLAHPARRSLSTRCGSQSSCVRYAKSLRRSASLSPREERAGRESERGETDKKILLSPALSSFLRRRGRENSVTRSKQIFFRTQRLTEPRSAIS